MTLLPFPLLAAVASVGAAAHHPLFGNAWLALLSVLGYIGLLLVVVALRGHVTMVHGRPPADLLFPKS